MLSARQAPHLVIWDDRPSVSELAKLDASCFSPPWDMAVFSERLLQPEWGFWVMRMRKSAAALGWAACRRVDQEAEIVRLGVMPGVRGRGWGKRLLEGVLVRLAKERARRVVLEVREGNRPALAIYEGAGFREVKRHANFYANPPEDALILARDLGRRGGVTRLTRNT